MVLKTTAQETSTSPRILLFDLETAPNLAYVWGHYDQNVIEHVQESYILSVAYKWLGEDKVYVKALPDYKGYKPEKECDRELCKDLWKLFDEADIAIGHNCVAIDTPVLKQDLTWVPAGSLQVGDKIVGFDEGTVPGETLRDSSGNWRGTGKSNREIKPAEVTAMSIENRPCFEVLLSNGDKVVTTGDHYWLGRTPKDNFYKWVSTADLKPGHRFTKFWNVWEQDKSYESGWLSGFISGEGTLKQSGKAFGVDFCQRPGSTWEQAVKYCEVLGYEISKARTPKGGGLGRGDTLYTGLLGGKFSIAEAIGRMQIQRFVDKLNWDTFGGLKGQKLPTVEVISVTPVGMREVAVMSTSTRTFFAAGYAMHNCDAFDIKKANTRFVYNGLPPYSDFRSIDTLKIAKKVFRFNSNKLDDLGNFLGIGRKAQTGGFATWRGCLSGDSKAWKTMCLYNQQDVALLERVYLSLRPWAKGHPDVSTMRGLKGCPVCGHPKAHKRGYAYTNLMRAQRYQCLDCKAYYQGPRSKIPLIDN